MLSRILTRFSQRLEADKVKHHAFVSAINDLQHIFKAEV